MTALEILMASLSEGSQEDHYLVPAPICRVTPCADQSPAREALTQNRCPM
jgi:hypothetical protein